MSLFVLAQDDVVGLRDVRTVEQVFQQVFRCKAWILVSVDEDPVPFG
jgi:hypothetical protein